MIKTTGNSTAPETGKPDSRRYTIIAGTFLSLVVSGMVMFSFGVFFKPVAAQFGWSRAETSGAFSLALIVNGVAGLIAGGLGDRFNPRLVVVICGALNGIAFLFLSHIQAVWQLYVFYGIIVGVGLANVVPANSLIVRSFKKQRGIMTGISNSGTAIGSAFVPPLATLLISQYSWSVSYLVVGIATLVLTAISAVLLYYSSRLKPPPEEIFSPQDTGKVLPNRTSKGLTFKETFSSRSFWFLSLILFCATFSQQIVSVHIFPHATDLGISPADAALILTIVSLACAGSSYFFGSMIDKIGSRKSMVISIAILLGSCLLLLVANSLWTFYLFAVIFGISWGGTSTLRSTTAAELFGLRSHGTILGAINLISLLGGTLSPLYAGYIFDITGQYQLAFITIIVLEFIGLLIALFLKYRR